MTRRAKLIILIGYLCCLVVFLFAYKTNRKKKIMSAKAVISQIQTAKDEKRKKEQELKNLMKTIPAAPDTTSIISAFYGYAKSSSLKSHEVSTEKSSTAIASARAAKNLQAANGLQSNRFKITISGGFRNIAEYIREIQNMPRFNRITDMKLTADKDGVVKGAITIEFYSLAAK